MVSCIPVCRTIFHQLSTFGSCIRFFHTQRKQISSLEDSLESTNDPKDIKALADAIARLSKIEQELDMRPNPGSLRPTSKRSSAGHSSDPEPEPA